MEMISADPIAERLAQLPTRLDVWRAAFSSLRSIGQSVNRSIEPRGAQTSEDMVHGSSVFIQPI
jgi:hypothetical protein